LILLQIKASDKNNKKTIIGKIILSPLQEFITYLPAQSISNNQTMKTQALCGEKHSRTGLIKNQAKTNNLT